MNAYTKFIASELQELGIFDVEIETKAEPTRTTIWHKKQPGFGVRHYLSGRSVYIIQTQMSGKLKTLTICNTKYLNKQEALILARRLILQAQIGFDPAKQKTRKRQMPTFQNMLDQYWEKRSSHWTQKTLMGQNNYRRIYLKQAFSRKLIDEIDKVDIQKWYIAIVNNGAPGAANRTLDILKAMFNRAIDWGYRPYGSNPCNDIKRIKGKQIQRYLTDEEYKRLGDALNATRLKKPLHYAAMCIILLTGCRKSEITHLRWGDVNLRQSRLELKKAKTGDRFVVVGEPVIRILQCLKRGAPEDYIWFAKGKNRPVSVTPYWYEVIAAAGLPGLRIHDARHSFASKAVRLNESTTALQAILGHAKYETTARYVHQNDDDLFEDVEKVSGLISNMLGAGAVIRLVCNRQVIASFAFQRKYLVNNIPVTTMVDPVTTRAVKLASKDQYSIGLKNRSSYFNARFRRRSSSSSLIA